ncbi:MAG: PIG-L family deacetylase [Nitrospirae bacterium]|nr:PIG-L family deacetylase [Nitrospirota bacterium]
MIDAVSGMTGFSRALVLSPHADDETLGCGGTIALMAATGAEIHVAVMSDGSKVDTADPVRGDELVAARKREAHAAAAILGVREVHFLDLPDGALQGREDEMSVMISELVESIKPDIIFSPSPTDYHPDHIAVSRVAIKLLKEKDVTIAFYEVYGTVRFNRLVNISSVGGIKDNAIMSYALSLQGKPGLCREAIKGFNRYRMLYTLKDESYEAFWVVSGPADVFSLLRWATYGLDAAAYGEVISRKDSEIGALRTRLGLITDSAAWRAAVKYYRVRDLALPSGSFRRTLFDKISGKIKKR